MAVETKTLAPTLAPGLAEREQVLRILREAVPRLRARGITRMGLFGSMARGEARSESDIDLLIEVDPDARLGLELYGIQEELGALLSRPVQFAFGSAMRPWLRDWIEEDRIGIY